MRQRTMSAIVADYSASPEIEGQLTERGYIVRERIDNGTKVLGAVYRYAPDLLVINAVLPGVDGLSAARGVLAAPLIVRPSILITYVPGFPLDSAAGLAQSGCAMLQSPVSGEALDRALENTKLDQRCIAPQIELRLNELFNRLDIPPREGRIYLKSAILLVYQDSRLTRALTGELYPMVARRHGVDAKKVERDMRRAIEHAWRLGKIDEQYAIFGGTIDAQRGKPTCGEMIAQLADILRLEG